MKRCHYSDGSYKDVGDDQAWEYANDPGWIRTTEAPTYGYEVQWCGTKVSVDGYESRSEAQNAAWKLAKELGYTLPRWYEFWRWFEKKEPRADADPKGGEQSTREPLA